MDSKKYPRTCHLPFSPEIHSDDKTIAKEYLANFIQRRVIITEKMDGGNTCIENGNIFARTHSSIASHASFDPIKNIYSSLQWITPSEIAIYGENLYGIHTIEYDELSSFLYVFNLLQNRNLWLGWDEVKHNCNEWGLETVPVLYDGEFRSLIDIQNFMEAEIKRPSMYGKEKEGFVIRIAEEFYFDDFSKYVAKYVRNGHIQNNQRWEENWRAAKIWKH
jgi:ATP-dependent RNA circularization protein (DNA/RNA ligase family)